MNATTLLCKTFIDTYPDEAARLLESMPVSESSALVTEIPLTIAGKMLARSSPQTVIAILLSSSREFAADCISNLPVDFSALLLRRMDTAVRDEIISKLTGSTRTSIEYLLRHNEGTAGAIMDPQILTVPHDITIADALKLVGKSANHRHYYLYAINRDQQLVGMLTLCELMQASPKDLISQAMIPPPARLISTVSVEDVVSNPYWSEFRELPLVDRNGILQGILRYDTVRKLIDERSHTRQLRSPMETVMALGELYWLGLSAMTGTMALSSTGKTGDK